MKLEQIDLNALTAEDRESLASLSTKKGHLYLDGGESADSISGYILRDSERPIGWVVAEVDRFFKKAEIHEFTLHRDYRGQGLGERLYSALESRLVDEGFLLLMADYNAEAATAPAYVAILNRHGFTEPKLLVSRYHFNSLRFNPPWLLWPISDLKGGQITPWSALSPSELERVAVWARGGAILPEFSPFGAREAILECSCSFALQVEGETVGWMLTHRVTVDTLCYSAFFLDAPYRNGRAALLLLQHSVLAQKAHRIPFAYIEINPNRVGSSWLRFVKRCLAPYAGAKTHIYMRWKKLQG